ncbi:hypothetical protein [Bdellovibrio sp.]|uniref:hypothetical protein n=1 Tax=Bdellovibrio sp. TaxID=28201 RepID=UPI0039E3A8BF
MKKLIASILAIYSALLMTGCGKNNDGGNTTNTNVVCPTGTAWNGSVCVNGSGVTVPNGNVQYYDYNRYFQSNGWGVSTANGDMRIVDPAAFKTFLKEAMAVCDRNIWGVQAGLASCDEWAAGSFMVSFSTNSSLKPSVRFEAYPAPSYFNWFVNFGIDAGGVAFNPLVLSSNNTFSLINNSKGFEIRAQGSYWNGGGLRLIQIQVLQGTLNDGYFTYDLYYPHNNVATKFATGKFKRY